MEPIAELVTLVVDGRALQGWQGVHVTRSAEAAAIAFNLRATNPAWSSEARAVRRGKQVEIYTTPDAAGAGLGSFRPSAGDLLCTGHCDDYEFAYASGSHEVSISGRSKAGDAIDCPPVKHKTGSVENKDLKGVAEEFDEWKIGFTADIPLKKLAEVQIVPGESLFACLEREARHARALLMGQPDGSVKITRAGKNRHAGSLALGEPPLMSVRGRLSIHNKRSAVHVRGQRALGVGAKSLRQEKVAKDESVGRHRPLIVHHEGDHVEDELENRAQWEMLRRSGSGVSLTVTVSTWRDEGGQIWQPGHLIAVQIEAEEIDQDLAISTVTFNQVVGEGEGSGTSADLTLVDPRTLGGDGSGSGSGSGAGHGGGKASPDFSGLPDDNAAGLPEGAFSNPSIKAGPR